MAFSYSFHLSNKNNALSSKGKISQASRHNLRKYKTEDYNQNMIVNLRGTDNILEDVKQIYLREFEEARIEYNQGKRADRKINNYLDHVSDSRSDAAAEIILQIGDKDFWSETKKKHGIADIEREMTPLFKTQLKELEKQCPDFKIASATIHYDESSPHLHIVGVPVADDYKKGMRKQVAKTKVFTKESLSALQDAMRLDAERQMKNIEIFNEMHLKEKEKGRNKDIPKSSLDEFQAIQEVKKQELERVAESMKNVKLNPITKKASLNPDEIALFNRAFSTLKNEIALHGNVMEREKELYSKMSNFENEKAEVQKERQKLAGQKAVLTTEKSTLKAEKAEFEANKSQFEHDKQSTIGKLEKRVKELETENLGLSFDLIAEQSANKKLTDKYEKVKDYVPKVEQAEKLLNRFGISIENTRTYEKLLNFEDAIRNNFGKTKIGNSFLYLVKKTNFEIKKFEMNELKDNEKSFYKNDETFRMFKQTHHYKTKGAVWNAYLKECEKVGLDPNEELMKSETVSQVINQVNQKPKLLKQDMDFSR